MTVTAPLKCRRAGRDVVVQRVTLLQNISLCYLLIRMLVLLISLCLFYEIQACSFQQVIKYVVKLHGKGEKVAAEVAELFSGELNPVAPKAQRKVPVPEG